MNPSRRNVLKTGGVIASAAFIGNRWPKDALSAPTPIASSRGAGADVNIVLRAAPARVVLAPGGPPAEVWKFDATRVHGGNDALAAGDGYLGPTIRVRPRQRLRVRFDNRLGESSIVHWHGLDVAPENDGHPMRAIADGASYQYDFRIENRPGLYWFHPHPHQRTGAQVYAGLAGLLLVVDDQDESRGLPSGAFDLPLVIQDRQLSSSGQLVYSPNTMTGFLGDRIFVNGRPTPTFDVGPATYRLRLLNGSNSRIYKLAWSDGSPMIAIGSDGGLLARPTTRPYVMLAPAERVEIWADFGRSPKGTDVWLESRTFEASSGGMMGMGGGMMGGGMMGGGMRGGGQPSAGTLPNGAAFRACRFAVKGPGQRRPLPATLAPVTFRPTHEVANLDAPRRFEVSMTMMRWLLNGRTFRMTEVADNERIRLGVTEDWEFANLGRMMAMPHPIHVHGGQFQVVSRSVAGWGRAAVATVNQGRIEDGWKDTFLLMPGETVRVRVRFENHKGMFLYHCHNLEHEDMGMMRNFMVEA